MSRRRRLRLGMVGGGPDALIGAVHRLAARMDDQFELVAGCFASTPERSLAGAAEIGVPPERAYGSYAVMVERERDRSDRIDAVAIVTPNHLHLPVSAAFLAAGFDVICDKPLTRTVAEGEDLVRAVEDSGRVFVLTHNYTAYPMVREARVLVAAGALGRLRMVQVEYPQDWLSTPVDLQGHKQAEWRTDPARSGPGGTVADIGSHAHNLACFVSGLDLLEVAADVNILVPGRRLDDNVHAMLRFEQGVTGMLWASQVAPGHANSLRLRVYGEKGSLAWAQEDPGVLHHAALGEAPRAIARGSAVAGPAAARLTRIPNGCPEGFLEGFANIYRDAAELIWARIEGRKPDPEAALVPGVREGLAGMRFIEAVLASGKNNGAWTKLAPQGGN
ncbi:MAG: Gfo/Idh/MocA family oxidoreductase [Geminicoccaceae bacterium]